MSKPTKHQQRAKAHKAYEAINDTAYKAYIAICESALKDYDAISNPAYEAFLIIQYEAWESFEARLVEIGKQPNEIKLAIKKRGGDE